MNYKDKINKIKDFIYIKGIHVVKDILPDKIIIDEKVRDYCIENKCGKYGKNFMCPPYVGSVYDFKEEISNYNYGIIAVIKDKIKDLEEGKNYYKSAEILHRILLETEGKCKELNLNNTKTLIGGNCRICKLCAAALGEEKCRYPKIARPSLEAVGIDVINTCKKVGINIQFKKDEVMWVGMVLI